MQSNRLPLATPKFAHRGRHAEPRVRKIDMIINLGGQGIDLERGEHKVTRELRELLGEWHRFLLIEYEQVANQKH